MSFDYSNLKQDLIDSWRDIYDFNSSLPENLLRLLPLILLLPHDYYDIIAAYILIPSVLANKVPYLFFHGRSGSGKTTIGKFISYLWGVPINTPTDSFVAIRNSLKERRYRLIEIPSTNPAFPNICKQIPKNIGMVWDDINNQTFITKPELYNLFKVGYDSKTDKIIIGSQDIGKTHSFRCFCPKVFSSVSAIHLNSLFGELSRRLIVILCEIAENLSDERLKQLNTSRYSLHQDTIDIDFYDWTDFNLEFANFWTTELAEVYLSTRRILASNTPNLTSTQKAISLDLLTTGIVTGIWQDEYEATAKLKDYFEWYKNEVNQYSGISKYLKDYVAIEQKNTDNGRLPLKINSRRLMAQINIWYEQNWILEKPKPKELKLLLAELSLVLKEGYWVKRS